MNNTATVETLTAEVRVLMVGNRQITLSVARQLDEISLDQIEPFGRVRLDKGRERYVIGRDRETGALAVSRYRVGLGWPHILDGDLSGRITACRNGPKFDRFFYQLEFRGRTIRVSEDVVEACDDHPSIGSGRCDHWNPNGLGDEISNVIAEHDKLAALHKAARELPLIVLAGLR